MSAHPESELKDLALGLLQGDKRAAAEQHVQTCLECGESLRAFRQSLAALDLALPPVNPSTGPLTRLRSQLAGPARFNHFRSRIAELFALSQEEATALLALIDDDAAWMEGPAPGVKLMPVVPGAGLTNALTALVRVEPGATFPEHPHAGEEQVLVLQGGFRHRDGTERWRGELEVTHPGTSHDFTAVEGPACICAAVTLLGGEDE